ncbi:MAG: CoA transferase [Deltaproteobacteria bacterium]|nr:MAG: CoA transferase [Deltaproteobacteria bacterium]
MQLPLEGVRVVEVATFVAVPAAGAMLADLGADVIKVEVPPRGEIYRRTRPRYMGYADCDFSEHPPFQMDNRGKRSIMLDLTRLEARDALLRVIDGAEVVITNLLPARRQKYGLDHGSLLARHPRLIVGAISGYGLGGDEADRPAFDYSAYWARSGLMDTMRDEGLPPSLQRPGVGDHAAAMNLVCGILSALRLRDADGRGRYVDVSLLQTALHIAGNDLANALVTREPTPRHDRAAPPNPLWNSYPVAGDRWIMLVMIESDRYWPRLCKAIDRPELETDPRFAGGLARAAHSGALVTELETAFAERTLDAWRPRLDAAGLIWAPVNRMEEVPDDPQVRAMGYVYELDHPTAGRFETVGPPFRIDGLTLGTRRPASALDADARAVLRDAGLDELEIERVLGDRPKP